MSNKLEAFESVWKQLVDIDHAQRALLLGNGASMAIAKAANVDFSFEYKSLLRVVANCYPSAAKAIETWGGERADFEKALRHLRGKLLPDSTLNAEEKKCLKQTYEEIKGGLIRAIMACHPSHQDTRPMSEMAAKFMLKFGSVFSLNYDLLAYKGMMAQVRQNRRCSKDGFDQFGEFRPDIAIDRDTLPDDPSDITYVYYAHGSLLLERISQPHLVTARSNKRMQAS